MIYITGTGQLGQELKKIFFQKKIEHKIFSIDEWDICDLIKSHSILINKPKILINTAAFTAVDKAETESKLNFEINTTAVENLSKICKEKNIYFIQISTDFVFGKYPILVDGNIRYWKPSDSTYPIGQYAISKDRAEKYLLSNLSSNYTVIRTSWLYSEFGYNFPRTILKLLSDPNRKELRVIEDQIGRPTWAFRLAEFIEILTNKILKNETLEKVLHFSNSGIASWYDFACAVQEIGLKNELIKDKKSIIPISTEEYPTPAERPRFSVMDLSSSKSIMKYIPHWREDLETCLSGDIIQKNWINS